MVASRTRTGHREWVCRIWRMRSLRTTSRRIVVAASAVVTAARVIVAARIPGRHGVGVISVRRRCQWRAWTRHPVIHVALRVATRAGHGTAVHIRRLQRWGEHVRVPQTCVGLLLYSQLLSLECVQVLDLLRRGHGHQVRFAFALLLLLRKRLKLSPKHAIWLRRTTGHYIGHVVHVILTGDATDRRIVDVG